MTVRGHLGVDGDRRQRAPDAVRDLRGDAPERGQALDLDQAFVVAAFFIVLRRLRVAREDGQKRRGNHEEEEAQPEHGTLRNPGVGAPPGDEVQRDGRHRDGEAVKNVARKRGAERRSRYR